MLSTRQVLLHRVTQERGTVYHSIAFLPDDEMTRSGAIGEWSVKDVLGHLAAWESIEIDWIEQFARGERPTMDINDVDGWNAQRAAERSSWSLAQTRDDLVATRKRLLDVVAALPDDVFERIGPPPMKTSFVQAMLNGVADHDREHWALLMPYKEEFLARRRAAAGG